MIDLVSGAEDEQKKTHYPPQRCTCYTTEHVVAKIIPWDIL